MTLSKAALRERKYITYVKRKLRATRSRSTNGCWIWKGFIRPRDDYPVCRFRGKVVLVHRLVAHLWLGLDMKSPEFVLRRCNKRHCINPTHLVITGSKEARRRGRRARGELNSQAKITTAHAMRIIELVDEGRLLDAQIVEILRAEGAKYCTERIVSAIAEGKRWKHLPRNPA